MAREDMRELLRLMEGIVAYERGTDFRLTATSHHRHRKAGARLIQ